MSDYPVPPAGHVGWIDLTVPEAEAALPVLMGAYNAFCMTPSGAHEPVAGVCHAHGVIEDPAGAVAGLFQAQQAR